MLCVLEAMSTIGFNSEECTGPFDEEQQTFPALLRDAGYRT